MKATKILLILTLAVVGFLLLRFINSLREEHAITGVIHDLERGIVTQNDQLVKSLYSEKIRLGKTVEHAKMMNVFLSMKEIQNFRISDIEVMVQQGSGVAHFRVTGEMVKDGEVIGMMDRNMTIQLSKSSGKWLISAHEM